MARAATTTDVFNAVAEPRRERSSAFSTTARSGQWVPSWPNYSAEELASIHVPVTIVQSEHDEFIKPEHTEYLRNAIPGADLVVLKGVSHFAPLQMPDQFNTAVLAILHKFLR